MENHNSFVGQRLTRLPPGFRFQPTDEEIVFEYLKCKILSLPLPASIIPELPLSSFDPWDLPGDDPEEERYFFTKKEAKYKKGRRTNRTTSAGYWRATGSEKQLYPSQISPNNFGIVAMKGLKKTFVFCRGKSPNGRRTDWFMHEYSLLLSHAMPTSNHMISSSIHYQNCGVSEKVEEWVICCVYLKQRLEKDSDATMVEYTSDNYANPNTTINNGNFGNNTYSYNYSSSSSSSNSVVEASSNGLEFEEINCPY